MWAATNANNMAKLVATANITIKVMIFLLISSLLSLCHSFITHPSTVRIHVQIAIGQLSTIRLATSGITGLFNGRDRLCASCLCRHQSHWVACHRRLAGLFRQGDEQAV
jgi:hypothetical protein